MSYRFRVGSSTIELVEGDITTQQVDAIVNAANAGLAGGGGVDGAIHRAGGPEILAECRKIGGCPTGDAVATTAGRLPAKIVIHAVGPRYRNGRQGEPRQLGSAYERALALAVERGCKSVALPSISTGAYGYPLEDAARVALGTAIDFVGRHPQLEHVRFVLFGADAFEAYKRVSSELAPTIAPDPS